jgi:hypothetical protein
LPSDPVSDVSLWWFGHAGPIWNARQIRDLI